MGGRRRWQMYRKLCTIFHFTLRFARGCGSWRMAPYFYRLLARRNATPACPIRPFLGFSISSSPLTQEAASWQQELDRFFLLLRAPASIPPPSDDGDHHTSDGKDGRVLYWILYFIYFAASHPHSPVCTETHTHTCYKRVWVVRFYFLALRRMQPMPRQRISYQNPGYGTLLPPSVLGWEGRGGKVFASTHTNTYTDIYSFCPGMRGGTQGNWCEFLRINRSQYMPGEMGNWEGSNIGGIRKNHSPLRCLNLYWQNYPANWHRCGITTQYTACVACVWFLIAFWNWLPGEKILESYLCHCLLLIQFHQQ